MAAAVTHPLADAFDDEAGLVDLVVCGVEVDRLALAGLGPQLLAQRSGLWVITAFAAPRMLALER
jgi:hypothetical protein